MLQYVLTGLAGIAFGIVAMRVWQARELRAPAEASHEGEAAENVAMAAPAGATRRLLVGAGILVVAAMAVFAFRSSEKPASASIAGKAANVPDGKDKLEAVDTMIARLAERLEKNPEDGEGFRMLGWSYVMTGHPEKAIEPYRRALKLLPNSAVVHSGYGEALVGVAGNKVTPEARSAFRKAIALDSTEPRARYFLALWQAQHGQEKDALEEWIALANDGPADAPWQSDVHRQISETSAKLGIDVSARLKRAAATGSELPVLDTSTVQAASQLPADERKAMVDGMVAGLAAKLEANPIDPDGWVRLLRSRMVLKQTEQAGKDLATARAALSGKAEALRKVEQAAAEFKVPGA